MDEQSSWRGQTFTLVIFGGIVALCSIFFILGMLVGRTQVAGLSGAEASAEESAAVPAPDEPDAFDFTFYESVDEAAPPLLEAPPEAAVPEPGPSARPEPPVPPVETGPAITLQVAALSNGEQAERLRAEIADRGFPSFVLGPAPGDAAALHRVQVGPFRSQEDVDRVKVELEAAGYRPIVRN